MQWLVALETDNDPIPACRVMNIFRRKGVKIVTLTLAAGATGFSLLAVVDTAEGDVDHIFNYFRRTDGVQHVTCYRHDPSAAASFVFIDAERDSSSVARFTQTFPESKLIFASHGKYLFEVPAESRPRSAALGSGEPDFLPFARIKSTRGVPRAELVGTVSEP